VLHFRWRTATIGAEMHWHGLIDHSNVPGRRFEEFADLCKEADQLAKYWDTKLVSKVAILYSVDSEYAFKLQPQTDGMYYMEQIRLLHSAFASYGINVDIIDQRDDLTGYQIVCAPEIYITEEVTAHKLYTFTEQGGTVILTTRTGVKDLNNNCIMQPLPGIYAELAGCHVEEYDPIGYDTVQIKLVDQSGTEPVNRMASGDTTQSEAVKRSGYTCRQWCDILHPDTAEVLAVYDSEFYQGKAAVTRNTYGSGQAYYIGTVGERAFYHTLAGQILKDADIPYFTNLPNGIEITTRTGKEQAVLFIFNNSDHIQDFRLMNQALSLQVTIQLQPFEMKIIETGL
ncbi:MAG: beta-galactosidase trimerization domain-containing protein, partial [Lachnospiraceae bacterium]|nr:beta-galactosidase trimerization domain-containing protein [Lachnospiraceae bacterium]